MDICFVAAGPKTWVSSRVRCYWPARYMDARVVTFASLQDRDLPAADTYIWQKQVDLEWVRRKRKAQHWWDVSEPAWWFDPEGCAEILQAVTGVVASNEALAQEFAKWNGRSCHLIPDRVEMAYFNRKRTHTAVSPVRIIWFGALINRVALTAAWPNLLRLAAQSYDIELTIMDDHPEQPLRFGQAIPIYHVHWAWKREVEILAGHDIALLPPIPGPWGSVRGSAKELSAQACRLPVTDGANYEELRRLVASPAERNRLGQIGYKEVVAHGTAGQSAAEWLSLLLEQKLA